MAEHVLRAALLVAVPVGMIAVGAWAMEELVGRQYVKDQLAKVEEAKVRRALNLRLAGYSVRDVQSHWGALDDRALAIEQRFLRVDLLFPAVYGTALCGALLFGRAALGWRGSSVWLVLPVLGAAIADWVENGALLDQLQRYLETEGSGLEASWIAVASSATTLKWLSLLVTLLLLVGMALSIGRGRERQTS